MELVEMKRRLGAVPVDDRHALLAEFEAHLLALLRRSRFEIYVASREAPTTRDIAGAAKGKGDQRPRAARDRVVSTSGKDSVLCGK